MSFTEVRSQTTMHTNLHFGQFLALLVKISVDWVRPVQKTLLKTKGLRYNNFWHNSCLDDLNLISRNKLGGFKMKKRKKLRDVRGGNKRRSSLRSQRGGLFCFFLPARGNLDIFPANRSGRCGMENHQRLGPENQAARYCSLRGWKVVVHSNTWRNSHIFDSRGDDHRPNSRRQGL